MKVIVSILQREDLTKNEDGTSWMVPPEWIWWWSSVLSKAADKTAWPESVRNFNLIGAHKDTNGEWIITPTMEAFAALEQQAANKIFKSLWLDSLLMHNHHISESSEHK